MVFQMEQPVTTQFDRAYAMSRIFDRAYAMSRIDVSVSSSSRHFDGESEQV